jgi:hypothetical protein
MPGKSLDDIWRRMQAQQAAEKQRRLAQEQALYEQRERARQEYLQKQILERNSLISVASAAAAAGGKIQTQSTDFPSVSAQSEIITWLDTTDNLWKYVVYNFDTGTLSDEHVSDMTGDDWSLDDDTRNVQLKGFTLQFDNNNDSTYRILFVNANGVLVGDKLLDTREDFRYTERAQGYLGNLNGIATLYHFDGDNVRTHTFNTDVSNIEIDDSVGEEVTEDGSMIIEAPNNEKYFIARPNGSLVEVTEYLSNYFDYRTHYNSPYIFKLENDLSQIKIISQEGSLSNTFDLTAFNMTSNNETYVYGDNCMSADFDDGNNNRLVVSYDGDSNQFVSITFSTPNNYRISQTRLNWTSPASSFSKNINIVTYNELGNDSLGYIVKDFKLWWLPKGADSFSYQDFSNFGTMSYIDGLGLGGYAGDNRSFTTGENPIFMYGPTTSYIQVAFLKNNGTIATQSTGILAASCSNIWGLNIAEHSFAVFDVGDNRVWQMYDDDSIVAQTETTSSWSWGDSDSRTSSRYGTLAVIDSSDTSKSFIYTTQIGLTAGPTGLGRIYNAVSYAINTGLAYEFQVISQYEEGESANQYVEGFYLLSKAGLSEYTTFFTGATDSYTINDINIGSEIVAFQFTNATTGNYRYQVYKNSTLELIHDYEYSNNDSNFYSYDNRIHIVYEDGSNIESRLIGVNGVELNYFTSTDFQRETNDADDND